MAHKTKQQRRSDARAKREREHAQSASMRRAQKDAENKPADAQPQPKQQSAQQPQVVKIDAVIDWWRIAEYVLGLLGTLGLGLVSTLYSSHKLISLWLFFFTITAFAYALYFFLRLNFWKGAFSARQLSPFLIVNALVLIFCLYEHQSIVHPPLSEFLPPSHPTSQPLWGGKEEPTFRENIEKVTFTFGSNTGILEVKQLESVPRVFPVSDNSFPLYFYVKNGKPYIDVKVYGNSQLIAVEVKENQFVIRPEGWDRNSSANALEIVNEKKAPVLQLYYKTPREIVVNGIFPTAQGVLYITENAMAYNPHKPPTIKRIFKYPSWQHPGEYEEYK